MLEFESRPVASKTKIVMDPARPQLEVSFFSVCVCTYFNKAPGKRPELVTNHPVQDKEGHIRNHAGEDEAMRDQSKCFNQS